MTPGPAGGGGVVVDRDASEAAPRAGLERQGTILASTPTNPVVGFSDYGGIVLSHVHVWLVFWGSAWSTNPSPNTADLINAVRSLLEGPYLLRLSQYRVIGPGSLVGSSWIADTDPQDGFTTNDVANVIFSRLQTGRMPEPDDDPLLLYCVVLPPGVRAARPEISGEHSFFAYHDLADLDLPRDVDISNVHFAWIGNDGSLDYVTSAFSHLVVEACTDPLGTAVRGDSPGCDPATWCEIGDVCASLARVNGVLVQSYWSQQDLACVIPDTPVAVVGASAVAAPQTPSIPVTRAGRIFGLYLPPAFFFWLELLYLGVLLFLAILWAIWPGFRRAVPQTIALVPIAVPWFGALGAVITGLAGIFAHNDYGPDPSTRWNPRFNFWHAARPLTGGAMGIVGYLLLVAVLSAAGAPTTNKPVASVLAFLFGYREESFRELIKKATDLLLWPGQRPPPKSPPTFA